MKTLFTDAISKALTIGQLFSHQAIGSQSSIHFIEGENIDSVPYPTLLEKSNALASGALAHGIEPGQVVIMCLDDEAEFIKTFWALQLIGAIAVPLSFPMQYDSEDEAILKLIQVYRTCEQPMIITDLELDRLYQLPAWQANVDNEHCVQPTALLQHEAPLPNLPPLSANIDDVAMLMFSSGSTGDAKGVQLTHRNLLTNLAQISERGELATEDSSLSWLPLTHDMGLILFHLCHTLMLIEQYKMRPFSFVRDPLAFLNLITRLKVTLIGMPNFGFDVLLRSCPVQFLSQLDLSSVRIIYNGAEPIDAGLCRRFNSHFEVCGLRRGVISPGYGIAEAGVAASSFSYKQHTELGEIPSIWISAAEAFTVGSSLKLTQQQQNSSVEVVSLGPIMTGMQVRILDDDGQPLPELHLGHVQLAGDNVTKGYWKRPPSQWCETGDLGFIYRDHIYLNGRSKDIVFINGKNHFSNDLELKLSRQFSWPANQLAIVGVTDPITHKEQVVLFYRLTRQQSPDSGEQLRATLERILSWPVIAIKIPTLPKTTSGKIRRFALREAWQNGEFADQLNQQSQTETRALGTVEQHVLSLLAQIHEVPTQSFDPQAPLSRYGFDSVGFAQLTYRLNVVSERQLTIAQVFKANNLAEIAKLVDDADFTRCANYESGKEKAVPLSESQMMLWISYQLDDPTMYNECYSQRFSGQLDVAQFTDAVEQVLALQPMLHTRVDDSDFPQLVLDQQIQLAVNVVSGITLDPKSHITLLSQQAFDLRKGPLIRIELLQLGVDVWELVLCAHHIVIDGWSFKLLLDKCFAQYRQSGTIEAADSGLWQLNDSPMTTEQQSYWQQLLQDAEAVQLPSEEQNDIAGACVVEQWSLDSELARKAEHLAGELNGSVFSLFSTLWSLLLARLSETTKPLLGTIFSGRNSLQDEDRVGYFAQTQLLALNIDKHNDFAKMHQDMQAQLEQLQLAPRLSLGQINENVIQDLPEMLCVIYVHQNMPQHDLSPFEHLEQRQYRTRARTQLYLTSEWVDHTLLLNLEYDSERFKSEQISYLGALFEHLLRQLTARRLPQLDKLNWICERQKALIKPYSDSTPSIDLQECFSARFARVAKTFSDKRALSDEQCSYSYLELKNAVDNLSLQLKAQGIEQGDRVCILTERSSRFVIALLATLQAGAVFVPIDPALPEDRSLFIINNCDASLLLSTDEIELSDGLIAGKRVLKFTVDTQPVAEDMTSVSLKGSDGAYIIYTSGSTGQPKGVYNDQKSLANLVQWLGQAFSYQSTERICLFAPFSFDVSIAEILPSLISGMHLYILPSEKRNSPEAYLETVGRQAINVATLTPAFFYQLQHHQALATEQLKDMRMLILGGEALKTDEVIAFQSQHPHIQLVNVYGPTETTVLSSYYLLPSDLSLNKAWQPLGLPVANTELLVLDEHHRLCPLMCTGEIYISGAGLSKGYWQDIDKTEAAFTVFSPDNRPPRRFYKTGDLARWSIEGDLDFVGRSDSQVKIRGFRVELGEIENCLTSHPDVTQSVVAMKPLKNGEMALVAYYCGEDRENAQFSEFIRQTLPAYMVPHFFIRLDEIPLTHNRKVDMKLLPSPEEFVEDKVFGPEDLPQGQHEQQLVDIWQSVLQIENISRHANFFELGGNSIVALRLVSEIRDVTGCQLELRSIYENSTLLKMAKLLTSEGQVEKPEIARQPQSKSYPASDAQSRMVFMQLSEPESAVNNIPMVFSITSPLQADKLELALQALSQRHPLLHCYFELEKAGVNQNYDLDNGIDLSVVTLQSPSEFESTCKAFLRRPFDMSKGPLWRVLLCSHGDEQWLALSIHHSISDGFSLNQMLLELDLIYQHKPLTDISDDITYADYSVWQQDKMLNNGFSKEVAFWDARADQHQLLNLPLLSEQANTAEGKYAMVNLEPEHSSMLLNWSKENNVSIFNMFVVFFTHALAKCCEQQQFNIGVTLSGRSSSQVQKTLGNFVNTLPLTMSITDSDSVKQATKKTQVSINELIEVQDYPLNRLMKQYANGKSLFNVLFNQEVVPEKFLFNNSPVQLVEIGTSTSKFPLLLSLLVGENQLSWRIEYHPQQLSSEWVATLQQQADDLIKNFIEMPDEPISTLQDMDSDIMALIENYME